MNNPNQVGGRATISTVSMGVLRSKQGATLDLGGDKRTGQTDDQGVAGFSVEPGIPSIDATFTQKGGVSAAALAAIVNEDIAFETDVGSHHVLRNAYCAETVTLTAGEIKAKFEGISCDEITA